MQHLIRIDFGIEGTVLPVSAGLSDSKFDLNYIKQFIFDGTNNAQDGSRYVYTVQSTIAASGTEVIDLSAPLIDPLGQSVKFTRVQFLGFYVIGSNRIAIGPNPTEGYTDFFLSGTEVAIPGANMLLLTNAAIGQTITENVNDKLRVRNLNTVAAQTYELLLGGSGTST